MASPPDGSLCAAETGNGLLVCIVVLADSRSGKLPTRQQFMDDMAAIFNAGEDSGFEKEPEQMGLFNAPEKPKQAKLADLKAITIDELVNEPRLGLVAK